MSKLEKAFYELDQIERSKDQISQLSDFDPRSKIFVTLIFLIILLSIPLKKLDILILFFIFPIISCAMADIAYYKLFLRSLIILPFVLLIGIFNPIYDREVSFTIGKLAITDGWISYISIIVRGILSTQAVFVLIFSTGFHNICRGLERIGVPSLFVTQLLFVYRYIFVLLQETLSMERAKKSRSFGQRSFPVKIWGIFIGQLLIRTINRSERIHLAMLSRGFNNSVPSLIYTHWRYKDSLYLILWASLFVLLRVIPVTRLYNMII